MRFALHFASDKRSTRQHLCKWLIRYLCALAVQPTSISSNAKAFTEASQDESRRCFCCKAMLPGWVAVDLQTTDSGVRHSQQRLRCLSCSRGRPELPQIPPCRNLIQALPCFSQEQYTLWYGKVKLKNARICSETTNDGIHDYALHCPRAAPTIGAVACTYHH